MDTNIKIYKDIITGRIPKELFYVKTPTVAAVVVDPVIATGLLDSHNKSNPRKLKYSRVDGMKSSMQLGRFGFGAQGISIGSDGQLVDGQHRLTALLASGVTLPFVVTFGCDPALRYDIDTLVTPRHHADNLMAHLQISRPKAEVAASGIKQVLALAFQVRRKLAQAELDALADAYQTAGVLSYLEKHFAKGRSRSQIQPIYGALATAFPLAPVQVREFTRLMLDLMDNRVSKLEEGSPVQALVNYLQGAYVYRRDPSCERAQKALKAVEKFIAGETMYALPSPTFSEDFMARLQEAHTAIIGTTLLAKILIVKDVPEVTAEL